MLISDGGLVNRDGWFAAADRLRKRLRSFMVKVAAGSAARFEAKAGSES